MKKEYSAPVLQWVALSEEDIIRTSQERLGKGEQGVEDHLSVAGL